MTISNQSLMAIIDSTLAFDSMTSVELFTLRLLLHEYEPTVNIQKDLQELAHFPERLLTSHRDEWVSYCRKHLFLACQQRGFSDPERVTTYLRYTREALSQDNQLKESFAETINQTETLLKSDNVELLESPASRKIRELIG